MKSVRLSDNLRYVSLNDEVGDLGLFVVHDGDRVSYTLEVKNRDEFVSALTTLKSIQAV